MWVNLSRNRDKCNLSSCSMHHSNYCIRREHKLFSTSCLGNKQKYQNIKPKVLNRLYFVFNFVFREYVRLYCTLFEVGTFTNSVHELTENMYESLIFLINKKTSFQFYLLVTGMLRIFNLHHSFQLQAILLKMFVQIKQGFSCTLIIFIFAVLKEYGNVVNIVQSRLQIKAQFLSPLCFLHKIFQREACVRFCN